MSVVAFRKLLRMDAAGWLDLVQAQYQLLAAYLMVRTRPRGNLISCTSTPASCVAEPGLEARACELSLAVGRVARHGLFRPSCLVRAIALRRLLESKGILGSQVRVGVQNCDGRFSAHSWVVYGGIVLGDTRVNSDRYAEIPSLSVDPET